MTKKTKAPEPTLAQLKTANAQLTARNKELEARVQKITREAAAMQARSAPLLQKLKGLAGVKTAKDEWDITVQHYGGDYATARRERPELYDRYMAETTTAKG